MPIRSVASQLDVRHAVFRIVNSSGDHVQCGFFYRCDRFGSGRYRVLGLTAAHGLADHNTRKRHAGLRVVNSSYEFGSFELRHLAYCRFNFVDEAVISIECGEDLEIAKFTISEPIDFEKGNDFHIAGVEGGTPEVFDRKSIQIVTSVSHEETLHRFVKCTGTSNHEGFSGAPIYNDDFSVVGMQINIRDSHATAEVGIHRVDLFPTLIHTSLRPTRLEDAPHAVRDIFERAQYMNFVLVALQVSMKLLANLAPEFPPLEIFEGSQKDFQNSRMLRACEKARPAVKTYLTDLKEQADRLSMSVEEFLQWIQKTAQVDSLSSVYKRILNFNSKFGSLDRKDARYSTMVLECFEEGVGFIDLLHEIARFLQEKRKSREAYFSRFSEERNPDGLQPELIRLFDTGKLEDYRPKLRKAFSIANG